MHTRTSLMTAVIPHRHLLAIGACTLLAAGCASDTKQESTSGDAAANAEVSVQQAPVATDGVAPPRDRDDVAPAPPVAPVAEAEEVAAERPRAPMRIEAVYEGPPGTNIPDPHATSTDADTHTEGYKDYGVNQMTDVGEDNLSTFAIDVDTGSYTIARRKLNEGRLPPAASVRVEEFVNYFRYDYPQPDRGPFGVSIDAAPSPFTAREDTYVMRVGVQGKRIAAAQRKPVHLTFLVDVSGSMNSRDKIGLAKKSLAVLTNNLQEGDTVALATYAGANRLVLPATGIAERGKILAALDSLTSGGGTAMSSGMDLAYEQAMKTRRTGHVNRVIVLSDGDANIGPASHQQILERVQGYVDEGITLSTIGFGMGNYKDTMMEQLANKGNGNYYYIDSIQEARKVFGEQLDGTLKVIAKDVKIQVEFHPEAVSKYRLIGYENRDIADKDFRDDSVDAGEIGAGHTVTALYEVIMKEGARDKMATVRVRHKKPDGMTASEQSFVYNAGAVATSLSDAPKDLQFATAVAGFAEILRESPYAENLSYALIEEVARSATSAGQTDREEFLALVKKAKIYAKK